MKKILHIVGAMYPGGLENFIMNINRRIDHSKVQFDVIVHSFRDGDYTDEIRSLGGEVFLAPRKLRHPIKNYLEIKRIIKEGNYDVVVRHSDNAFPIVDLMAAKSAGAKRRIYHSHSSNSSLKGLHRFFRHFMGLVPTDRFACSDNAGKWMYGKRDYKVINNAIDIKAYTFNSQIRERYRKDFGYEDKVVYSHVGIYMPAKNHSFLIEFFAKLVAMQPNAVLLLIGEGDLRAQMEAQIESLGMKEHIILTGIRSDVSNMLQMTDVFLFPSVYEGLPLSVIEAQSAGLKCLISDNITDEVVVTDLVKKKKLDDGALEWAKAAIELSTEYERKDTYSEVAAAGYDVVSLAKWYETL